MAVKNADYYKDAGVADAQAARRRGDSGTPFPFQFARDSNSWQARAYWIGFDQEGARMAREAISEAGPTSHPTPAEKTRPDANPEAGAPSPTGRSASAAPPVFQNLPVKTPEANALIKAFNPKIDGVIDLSSWPDAPRSHYLALSKQLEAEIEPARINRLSAAMNRMIDRWGAK